MMREHALHLALAFGPVLLLTVVGIWLTFRRSNQPRRQ